MSAERNKLVRGSEIQKFRAGFRLSLGRVAEPLGISTKALLQLEQKNGLLPTELLPKWAALHAFLRTSRGHIPRARMKELPFARPVCDGCDLPLHRGIRYYSKRLRMWLYRLDCGTPGCKRFGKVVYFNTEGERVDIPNLAARTPFERPLCEKCRRPLVAPKKKEHPKFGTIYSLYCNNSECDLRYRVCWFDQQRGQVTLTGRGHSDLPMEREICPRCKRPKVVSRKYHKRSERWLWPQQCRRQGCPGTVSWYDAKGMKLPEGLKSFRGPARKYSGPPCPHCGTDSLTIISHRRSRNVESRYVQCKKCDRKFDWKKDTGELRSLDTESLRRRLQRLLFPRPTCPHRDANGAKCGGDLTIQGARSSGRRGKYWVFRCRKCVRYSWSKDGRAYRCQLKKPRLRGRPAKKAHIFSEARKLHVDAKLSWTRIANRLTPEAYADDPRRAAEAIRLGAGRVRT